MEIIIVTFLLSFGNFQQGTGIAADATGNIYVSDAATGKVIKLGSRGDSLGSAGGAGWGDDALDIPRGIAANFISGIFVADLNNHRIQQFQRDMSYVSTLFKRDSEFEKERFGFPSDVAVQRNGDILVCDTENKRIVQFTSAGEHRRTFGEFDAGAGRLKNPRQIALTTNDQIYVLDGDNTIARFDNFGTYIGSFKDIFKTPVTTIFSAGESIIAASDSTLYFLKSPSEITEIHIPKQFVQTWQDGTVFKNMLYLVGKRNATIFLMESISDDGE